MIDEVMRQLQEITQKNDCQEIFNNIQMSVELARRDEKADEIAILALAFSFIVDFAIREKNLDLIHDLYSLAGNTGTLKALKGNKSYEIIYRLKEELLNIFPENLDQLVAYMEGFESQEIDYNVLPYDERSKLRLE